MRSPLHRAGVAALAAGWLVAVSVSAQTPPTDPATLDLAKQQQERQQTQPLNNAPVWKEIRSGVPQTTSLPGRETNVLIQSEGQTWRAMRVPAATIGGFVFVGALLAIAAFYLWRGPIRLHGTPTGRLIERFNVVERVVHWTVAISFVTLGITGLIITFGKSVLLPLIGYTLFSWLAILSKNLHNFIGPVLVVALPIMIVVFMYENIPRAYDWIWIRKFGGYLTNEHIPAGKANAGQKILFWLMVVVVGLTLCVTGLILDFPNFNQTRQTMQTANMIHLVAGVIGCVLVAGHIYLGTIGMQGAYEAMRYGYVDETWAREHHEYWYNDVMAGRDRHAAPPVAPRHEVA
ncbi:MAG TPA: formate dehydrogenase subunit gamma [Casimicrobiaceae bacterium]|nr:formate dehydrogenase subunit gamma [Casimicrobiaceae bacterium]